MLRLGKTTGGDNSAGEIKKGGGVSGGARAARWRGIGMGCLAATIEHARNRVTFGRRLAERQAIQWMLADLSVELRTCTWLTLEAAERRDQGLTYFAEAALG